ncbi:MAG: SDR family oxidoreductase [Bacteroidota bacterium]|nr:SDR family oxidoreductase [Bacteroidota bacterium]
MNIIINGGTGGIGRELVICLANDNRNYVLFTGRNEARMKKIASACLNKNVSFFRLDLNEFNDKKETIKDKILKSFSRVDILINCSGSLVVDDFLKISDQEARMMMETNFFGPAALIKLLVPLMPPGAHIVNISSMGGFQGSSKYRGLAYYSASKAALANLTECLAGELSNLGININCLALGSVQTEMFEKAFPGHKSLLQPDEAAEFISYFALNGSKFFNGKVLPVAVSNP